MNIAIYGRVSTDGQSTDLQVSELTAYVGRMSWAIAETYLDKGVSGTKDKRPALDKLMDDARLRRFDAVLVWKLDRFGRSLSQLVHNVQLLDGYGVRFISLTENVDTDIKSPTGRLMLHLFAAFAEFERNLIVERVRAGVAEAQRRGKHCGRPAKVFRRDEAVQLRQEGLSYRAIAKKLGIAVMTVSDAVRKASPIAPVIRTAIAPVGGADSAC
jgi:putative DNA-invertase from lambdoid prophage Rac